jgi:nucleoside 2-deoxyribosyltransferase
MKIYCARPITGCTYKEVVDYYEDVISILKEMGYEVLCPMCGKSDLSNESEFKPHGYTNPLSTNHAITERDRWMTKQSDILLIYLVGATKISIGSVAELAWAHDSGKHTILVMEEGNVHQHAFVLEMADVIYPDLQSALDYLEKLAKGKI